MISADKQDRITARLLLCAAIADLFVINLLCTIVLFMAGVWIELPLPWLLAVFFGCLLLYGFVTEILLSGHTVGRLCLGLTLTQANGAPPTPGGLINRYLRKTLSLGLTGLVWNRAASHDRNLRWSDSLKAAGHIEPRQPASNPKPETRPQRQTQRHVKPVVILRVENGPHEGLAVEIRRPGRGGRPVGLNIGRDVGWADFPLPGAVDVSGKHCILLITVGDILLKDHGTDGTGSTNGTTVHGRPISHHTPTDISGADHFKIGNTRISIR